MIDESQLAKYRRQQCINLLDTITKNIFKMLRNDTSKASEVARKFGLLYSKLAKFDTVYLDTDYHRQTRKYIDGFAKIMRWQRDLESLRSSHMTQLNRLQKLKNAMEYKREKYVADSM